MLGPWRACRSTFREQAASLVLVNGLAGQAQTWFRNRAFWQRHFEVYLPSLLVYDGAALHQRIRARLPVSVAYLVEQLHAYLEARVPPGPCHLVASSLGGKVAVEYAVQHPDRVGRLVLLSPAGMGDQERLPLIEGVRHHDTAALVGSVFHDPRCASPGLVAYYQRRLADRRWRKGFLRTVRGTLEHSVRARLAEVRQPTLLVSGRDDRIVATRAAMTAARLLPQGRHLILRNCGHAPQIEKPRTINRLVVDFLTGATPLQIPLARPVLSLNRFADGDPGPAN
jgi:pimeloyl-ACP methyl ester carboxylesterase